MLDINETPVGAINGVNKIFTLSKVPLSNQTVKLWVMGDMVQQGVFYTVNGQIITTTDPILLGSWMFVNYLTEN